VREAFVEKKLATRGHESDHNRATNAAVEASQKDGPHSPARKAGAAHPRGVHVRPRGKDIQRPPVLCDVNAGPGGPRAQEAFLHDVLMRPGERVVFVHALLVLRFRVTGALPDALRNIRCKDATASKRKSVVDKHSVAALCDFVGPRSAAVIPLTLHVT